MVPVFTVVSEVPSHPRTQRCHPELVGCHPRACRRNRPLWASARWSIEPATWRSSFV